VFPPCGDRLVERGPAAPAGRPSGTEARRARGRERSDLEASRAAAGAQSALRATNRSTPEAAHA
jgi:hypothetical protein